MKSILKKSVLVVVLVVFGLTFTSCQKDSDKQEDSKKTKLIFLIIRMIPKMEFQVIKATTMEATTMEATIMETTIMEATIMEATIMEATIMEAIIMEAIIMEAIIMEAITMEVTIIKHKLLPFL